jgi:hypothetical protein
MPSRALATAALVLLATACGDDGGSDFCVPQGRVVVGAVGTAGAPLTNFADCYSGQSPALSLDGARGATADGNSLTFDDGGLTATIDDTSCRIEISYTYDTMLSDDTPATGTSMFAATPDPDTGDWTADAEGSNQLEWTNAMNDTNVCGNQIDGVVIAVERE